MTMDMGRGKNGNVRSKVLLALMSVGVFIIIGVGIVVAFPKTTDEPQEHVVAEPTSVKAPGRASPSKTPSRARSPLQTRSPATTSAAPEPSAPVQSRDVSHPQVQQPMQKPTYTRAPEPVCSTGSVAFRLDSVEVIQDANHYNPETVASGTIVNESGTSVDIDLWGEAHVVGIDAQGVVKRTLYAEVVYTPPVGVKRPSTVTLMPGGQLDFKAPGGGMPDDSIQSWILDPDATGTYIFYSENQPSGCDYIAPATIASGPILSSGVIGR